MVYASCLREMSFSEPCPSGADLIRVCLVCQARLDASLDACAFRDVPLREIVTLQAHYHEVPCGHIPASAAAL